jgi:hypothetical protein
MHPFLKGRFLGHRPNIQNVRIGEQGPWPVGRFFQRQRSSKLDTPYVSRLTKRIHFQSERRGLGAGFSSTIPVNPNHPLIYPPSNPPRSPPIKPNPSTTRTIHPPIPKTHPNPPQPHSSQPQLSPTHKPRGPSIHPPTHPSIPTPKHIQPPPPSSTSLTSPPPQSRPTLMMSGPAGHSNHHHPQPVQ